MGLQIQHLNELIPRSATAAARLGTVLLAYFLWRIPYAILPFRPAIILVALGSVRSPHRPRCRFIFDVARRGFSVVRVPQTQGGRSIYRTFDDGPIPHHAGTVWPAQESAYRNVTCFLIEPTKRNHR